MKYISNNCDCVLQHIIKWWFKQHNKTDLNIIKYTYKQNTNTSKLNVKINEDTNADTNANDIKHDKNDV